MGHPVNDSHFGFEAGMGLWGAWPVCVCVPLIKGTDLPLTLPQDPRAFRPHVKSSQNLARFYVAGLSTDLSSTPLSLRLVLSRYDDFVTRANSILQTAYTRYTVSDVFGDCPVLGPS